MINNHIYTNTVVGYLHSNSPLIDTNPVDLTDPNHTFLIFRHPCCASCLLAASRSQLTLGTVPRRSYGHSMVISW